MPATVWSGQLAFGLVSIPVRLHKAARRERTRFHHVHQVAQQPEPEPEQRIPVLVPPRPMKGSIDAPVSAGHAGAPFTSKLTQPAPLPEPEIEAVERVRHTPIGSFEEAPVQPAEILKGYELQKDQYVVFRPQELAALRPRTSTELDIGEFVRLEEIDPIYFDTSYYVAPDRGGEKPYALLFHTLQKTGYAALGTLAMHGREHATIIRPGKTGLILHTLFYGNEVRTAEEYRCDPGLVGDKELELATKLVEVSAEKFDPTKLKDVLEERIRALIESRSANVVSSAGYEAPKRAAPVVDILEALRKSLEMRKPVKRESAAPVKEKTVKRPRRSAK